MVMPGAEMSDTETLIFSNIFLSSLFHIYVFVIFPV